MKQPARKSPRDRSAFAKSRREDNEEQGYVPMNQNNNKEQDENNFHGSAEEEEEEEEEEEDPSDFDKDNQDQNEKVVIDMADDSDAGSVGPHVVDPVALALVTMMKPVFWG